MNAGCQRQDWTGKAWLLITCSRFRRREAVRAMKAARLRTTPASQG